MPSRNARLLASVTVALVALVSLSVVVLAVQDRHGELVIVPPVQSGDAGSYSLTLSGGWVYGSQPMGTPFHLLDFRWSESDTIRDALGRERPAESLLVSGLDYAPFPGFPGRSPEDMWVNSLSVHWFEPGGDRLLASDRIVLKESETSLRPAGEPTPALGSTNTTVLTRQRSYVSEAGDSLCVLGTTLAGANPSRDGITWPRCSLGQVLPSIPGGHLVAVQQQTFEDMPAVEMHSSDGTLRVWMANGISVPVRIEADLEARPWLGEEGPRTAVLELSSFMRGDQPRPSEGSPGSPLAALQTSPRTPWMFDETGVTSEFHLSQAYAIARDHEDYSGLRDLLARSPDAYIAYAAPFQLRGGSETVNTWSLMVTDGTELLSLQVDQVTQPGAAGVGLGAGYLLPPGPAPTITSWSVDEVGRTSAVGLFPHPDLIPNQMPTVAALLDRWALYSGRSVEEGNSWSILVGCGSTCETAMVFTGAGIFSLEFDLMRLDPANPSIPLLTADSSADYSHLIMRNASEAHFLLEIIQVSTFQASTTPGEFFPQMGPETVRPVRSGLAFSAGEGAGVGLLATLMGLLYLAWPSLKAAAVGLFSRVNGPRLLEHPARARLHQIIQAEPGVHFQDLARRAALANGTAVHHLGKLAQAGLVSARPLGRYTCYFPGQSVDRVSLAVAPVTRSDGARRILAELAANPGLSGHEVAMRLGLQHSTVSYHVRRLQDVGLVAAQRDGRVVRLHAATKT